MITCHAKSPKHSHHMCPLIFWAPISDTLHAFRQDAPTAAACSRGPVQARATLVATSAALLHDSTWNATNACTTAGPCTICHCSTGASCWHPRWIFRQSTPECLVATWRGLPTVPSTASPWLASQFCNITPAADNTRALIDEHIMTASMRKYLEWIALSQALLRGSVAFDGKQRMGKQNMSLCLCLSQYLLLSHRQRIRP